MDDATWSMLNETEKALLRQAEPRALAELDEDGLLQLHDRIRRARSKYTKLYRRRAGEQVAGDAHRARAHPAHARTAVKAEAFEEVLATVSRKLAAAAKASAGTLKKERLAAARASKASGSAKRAAAKKAAAKTKARKATGAAAPARQKQRTPIKKKAAAAARSTTRRSQAKRDKR